MSIGIAKPYATFVMKDLGSNDKGLLNVDNSPSLYTVDGVYQPNEKSFEVKHLTRKRLRDHDDDILEGVYEGWKSQVTSGEINPEIALVSSSMNVEAEEKQQEDCAQAAQQIGATVYDTDSQSNADVIEAAAQNNILLVHDLPYENTDRWATAFFRAYPGFKGTRLIEEKPGMAYVEFDNVRNAARALRIETRTTVQPRKVTYASK